MSIEYELMDFTMELAKAYGIDPFHILAQEKDDVFLLINYYIEKPEPTQKPQMQKTSNSKRRKVTNASATGGWF